MYKVDLIISQSYQKLNWPCLQMNQWINELKFYLQKHKTHALAIHKQVYQCDKTPGNSEQFTI